MDFIRVSHLHSTGNSDLNLKIRLMRFDATAPRSIPTPGLEDRAVLYKRHPAVCNSTFVTLLHRMKPPRRLQGKWCRTANWAYLRFPNILVKHGGPGSTLLDGLVVVAAVRDRTDPSVVRTFVVTERVLAAAAAVLLASGLVVWVTWLARARDIAKQR